MVKLPLNHCATPVSLNALLFISLTFLLPGASAQQEVKEAEETGKPGGTAEAVDTVGFWLGFTLLVVVSAMECVASLLWTRFRVTSDGIHPHELSCRVFGREIFVTTVDAQTGNDIAENGIPAGFYSGTQSSVTYTQWGAVTSSRGSSHGCSTCGGIETRHTQVYHGATEVVVDKFGCLILLPMLLIRRFNPMTSLQAPSGLVDNVKDLVKGGKKGKSVGRVMEYVVHLAVGLTDVALGVAGLALNPGSPERLYETLKDPEAPITFENYLTLFLLYWLLGAVLLVGMIPLHSKRRSIQMFGWPGIAAYFVASLTSLVLFALGSWKIDVARRTGADWTPMLAYWIGGASAISFPLFGIEVFHTFGVVGLGFMLKHTF